MSSRSNTHCMYVCAWYEGPNKGKCPHQAKGTCRFIHVQRKCAVTGCTRDIPYNEEFCAPCTVEYELSNGNNWPCQHPHCHRFARENAATKVPFDFCAGCARAYSEAKANGKEYHGPESMPDEYYDAFLNFGCIEETGADADGNPVWVKLSAAHYDKNKIKAAREHYQAKNRDDDVMLRQATTPPMSAPPSRVTSMATLKPAGEIKVSASGAASHGLTISTTAPAGLSALKSPSAPTVDDTIALGLFGKIGSIHSVVSAYAAPTAAAPAPDAAAAAAAAAAYGGFTARPGYVLNKPTMLPDYEPSDAEGDYEGDEGDTMSTMSKDEADAIPAAATAISATPSSSSSTPLKTCALISKHNVSHGPAEGLLCSACQTAIVVQMLQSGKFVP